jgi:2-C-methyl-D-erythritol 2,4-cyclodiphosphate synthase
MRVSWGFDAHRFGGPGPLRFAGVVVDDRGVEATSDGDVVAHAVADAVLGAAGLGDLGQHFPSSDPQSEGADSMAMLVQVVDMAQLEIAWLDVTIIAEKVRVSPHRAAIAGALAKALGLDGSRVSVKGTSTDGMGFVGHDEGLAAVAVVTCHDRPPGSGG